MSKAVLVLVETVDDYLPMLEQAGYHLIRAPRRNCVFDDEPAVPDALKALPNTVLTPHVAGQSPEAARDTVDLVLRNLQAFFAGEPVLTPVRP